jgi:hypothetical protein
MKIEEGTLLVELLEFESVSPSLKLLELEPSCYELNENDSLRWAVLFTKLGIMLREQSTEFRLSQRICSCDGLLPRFPYMDDHGRVKRCFLCRDTLPEVCFNCQKKLNIKFGIRHASFCDSFLCGNCVNTQKCKFCGNLPLFGAGDNEEEYASRK